MFNPPYSLVLCELTPTIYADEQIKAELKEYLSKKRVGGELLELLV